MSDRLEIFTTIRKLRVLALIKIWSRSDQPFLRYGLRKMWFFCMKNRTFVLEVPLFVIRSTWKLAPVSFLAKNWDLQIFMTIGWIFRIAAIQNFRIFGMKSKFCMGGTFICDPIDLKFGTKWFFGNKMRIAKFHDDGIKISHSCHAMRGSNSRNFPKFYKWSRMTLFVTKRENNQIWGYFNVLKGPKSTLDLLFLRLFSKSGLQMAQNDEKLWKVEEIDKRCGKVPLTNVRPFIFCLNTPPK